MNPLARTTLAIAAALAADSASAVIKLQPNGMGDAVYIPYYTVENSQDSLLTITNSGDLPSAIHLLFAEALNGQNVMSFNVYLPARSTWTATVTSNGEAAKVVSQSNVCTLPQMPAQGIQFLPYDYANNYPDGGPTGQSRVRTGAVEIIELGTLTGALAEATTGLDCSRINSFYIHQPNQPPPTRAPYLQNPSSRISASVHVVNVAQGVIFPVAGHAIAGHNTRPYDVPTEDILARIANPRLAAGESSFETETAAGRLVFDANRGADAISSLFMQSELSGEFYTEQALASSTRWVLSFPTKHAYVSSRPGSLAQGSGAVAPFSDRFDAEGSCDFLTTASNKFDGGVLSESETPVDAASLGVCSQVNVIPFAGGLNGSLRFDLSDNAVRVITARRPDGGGVRLRGLPAVGVQLSNFVNGQAQPGVLANYSIAQPLRGLPSEAD